MIVILTDGIVIKESVFRNIRDWVYILTFFLDSRGVINLNRDKFILN
jgi:hypothetical protein